MDYLNRVDSTYQSQLKEFNELNCARFDAKLEQRLAELKAEMTARFATADAGLERVRSEIAAARADVIKWMFVVVATAVLAILGLR